MTKKNKTDMTAGLPFAKVKSTKKPKISKLKKDLWNIFSKYIRLRDAIETTGTKYLAVCCTCGKQYPAFGKKFIKETYDVEVEGGSIQAGHFIPGRGNAVLIDERGVHAQCYNCNILRKGEWVEYERFMIKKYGKETVDELKADKGQSKSYTPDEIIELIDLYKQKYKNLEVLNED